MSDIETYLTELRSHLSDLDPKRAKEIIAEARTHLESRAAQFEATGMSHEEASAQAARSFGEPARVAADLLAGNSRHRRPSTVRVVAIAWAFAISLATALALAQLSSAPESWNSPFLRFVSSHTALDPPRAYFLLFVIQLLPAAYLFGLVAGRRFSWLAAAPGVLWIGLSPIPPLFYRISQPYATLPRQLLYALAIPALAALVLGGAGWLGARLAMSSRPLTRRLAHAIAIVSGLYAVSIALLALGLALDGPEAHSIAAVAAAPVALTFLAAARKDRRLSHRLFLLFSLTVSAAGILFVAAMALVLRSLGPSSALFGQALLWLTIVAVECLAGLIATLAYAARTRPAPAPSLSAGT